jgi:hypothetical protein
MIVNFTVNYTELSNIFLLPENIYQKLEVANAVKRLRSEENGDSLN